MMLHQELVLIIDYTPHPNGCVLGVCEFTNKYILFSISSNNSENQDHYLIYRNSNS